MGCAPCIWDCGRCPSTRAENRSASSARSAALNRQAVIGAGIVGDPTSIPWLIRKMDSPELARLAWRSLHNHHRRRPHLSRFYAR